MKRTIVLGLNCSHDAAAAIAIDGVLVSAISEERLTKAKHFDGFPHRAIEYCIKDAGLDRASVKFDSVVINELAVVSYGRKLVEYFPAGAVGNLIVNPSHHYLHACYAEMLTEQRPLVILVVDGSGYSYAEHRRRGSPLLGPEPSGADMWESLTAYYVGEDGKTSLLIKDWGEWRDFAGLLFPSLGHMYGAAAQRVFGSWVHAGKLMGLAPFGDPQGIGGKPIVTLTSEGVEIDTDWLSALPRIPFSPNFENVPLARDVAARVQSELERAMMHLCRILKSKTGCEAICLTGGVALNSVFNGLLANEGLFRHVVVSPAAADSGTAIGAAAYGHKQLTGRQLRLDGDPEFLGHDYSAEEIGAVLERAPNVIAHNRDNVLDLAVQDLAAGKIIGWFEGRAEFGPRALGHRSILADPRGKHMKDRLNGRVKFREAFRPYAAAVLEEHCPEWFEQSVESPHMLMVATVRPSKRDLIPAVIHVDHTCRLQTVGRQFPGSLRPLIERFFDKTGVPLILNTSLNIHGQPMAETPQDALDCLIRSGLDVLYCGNYRVEKRAATLAPNEFRHTLPVPSAGYRLVSRYDARNGLSTLAECSLVQGNRQIRLSPKEQKLLMSITGNKTVGELANEFPDEKLDTVASWIQSLCERGVLYLSSPAGAPGREHPRVARA